MDDRWFGLDGVRVVDITTTGRRSGRPRRVEVSPQRLGDRLFITGLPTGPPRQWYENLRASPQFTLHLPHGDVAARARVIEDAAERRELLPPIVEHLMRTRGSRHDVEAWVARSPLVEVELAAPKDTGAHD